MNILISLAFFLFFLLAACADNKGESSDPLFSLSKCSSQKIKTASPRSTGKKKLRLLATVSDRTFSVGQFVSGLLGADGGLTSSPPAQIFGAGSDSLISLSETSHYLFVVNRLGSDSIQVFLKEELKSVGSYSVGLGSNAQDLVSIGDSRVYVSRLNQSQLLRMDALDGSGPCGIDFSGLSDEDGIPEMSRMLQVEDEIWVAVQRLNRKKMMEPSEKSFIARVNVDRDELMPKPILLKATNPYTAFKRRRGSRKVYIGTVGKFGEADGGIEQVDPVRGESEGFIFTEEKAQGDILDFEILAEDLGVAMVQTIGGEKFSMRLVSFNPRNGQPLTDLAKTGEVFSGLVFNSDLNLLYFGDRSSKNGRVRSLWIPTFMEGPSFPLSLPPLFLELTD